MSYKVLIEMLMYGFISCSLGLAVLRIAESVIKSKPRDESNTDDKEYEHYDVKLIGKNTYTTVLKLVGGREIELVLKSDKELKKTQIFPLLAKLEAEDTIKSGIYDVDSTTFQIRESKLTSSDNIISLEKLRDINNESAISVKDTDIESSKSYSIHVN